MTFLCEVIAQKMFCFNFKQFLSYSIILLSSLHVEAGPPAPAISSPSFSLSDGYVKFSILILPVSNKTVASEFFQSSDFIDDGVINSLRRDLTTIINVRMPSLVVLSITNIPTNLTQTLPIDKQISENRRRQLFSTQVGIELTVGVAIGNFDTVYVSTFINRTVNLLANPMKNQSIPFLPTFSNALVTKSFSKSNFTLTVDLTSFDYILPLTKTSTSSLSVIYGSSIGGGLAVLVCVYILCRMFFIAKTNKEALERELRIVRPALTKDNPLRMRDKMLEEDKRRKIFIPLSTSTRSVHVPVVNTVTTSSADRRADAITAVEVSSAQWEDSFGKLSDLLGEDIREELETIRINILKLESRLKRSKTKKGSEVYDEDDKNDDIVDGAEIDFSKLWLCRKEGFDTWYENVDDPSLIQWELPHGDKVISESKLSRLRGGDSPRLIA